ncbi:MAG: hypothetical protein NTZ18_03600 [Candidatus Komeilibacteria bacterium]|nr:hypothetical protein [Candidatus Komeilibacteria bacterium]
MNKNEINALEEGKINTGLILPSVDSRNAIYEDQFLLGGQTKKESRNWSNLMPPKKWQGYFPFCVAYMMRAVIYALNKANDAHEPEISPIGLFFRGGGGPSGSRLDSVANESKDNGAIFELDKPTPDYDNTMGFMLDQWEKLKKYGLDVKPEALERAKYNKIKSFSFVETNNLNSMMDALDYSPLGIAVPVYKNYFFADKGFTASSNPIWHAVMLVKMFNDGSKVIFDSLHYSKDFTGFHILPPDYPVGFAMSYRDLPDDWKNKNIAKEIFPNAYDRYHKQPIDSEKEKAFALELRRLVETYPDPGIRTIAGRFWVVMVNAALYGGYSCTVKGPDGKDYFAYKEKGSDLANALYHFRRHGSFPFDFNKLRINN